MSHARSLNLRYKVVVLFAAVFAAVLGGLGWLACGGPALGQCAQCNSSSECRNGLVCVSHNTNCRALPGNLLICDRIGYCEPSSPSGTVAPDPDPCPAPR
jgi:hypothetical protein